MTNEDTFIRAGIVGIGFMGRWHAWAIKRAGGCLSAVTDIDSESVEHVTKSNSGAESYLDIEHMLNMAKLNVLHVCTPPSTHYKIAEIGINAGLTCS